MLQELLPLLPKEVGSLMIALAIAGTLIGAALWLIGGRFSRSLITLVLVSAGGWVGLYLPTWCGWAIDGWVVAIGLAVAAGASGFFMHRLWVAVGFGLVLTAWTALAVWLLMKHDGTWAFPKLESPFVPAVFGKALWQSVPPAIQQVLPYACGMALVSGFSAALLWPRLGLVLLYSMAGVTIFLGLGMCLINAQRPQWIRSMPATWSSQLLILSAMVGFGAVLQWNIAPSKKSGSSGAGSKPAARKPMVVTDD
jgi:hypothetical protein